MQGRLIAGAADVGTNQGRHAFFRAVLAMEFERLGHGVTEITKEFVRGSTPQLILVLEVVRYQGMVNAGTLGDVAC